MKALPFLVRKRRPRLKIFKSRSNFKVNVNRSKFWYPCKGLVTRNVHMKYESPTSSGKEAMAKVKVF